MTSGTPALEGGLEVIMSSDARRGASRKGVAVRRPKGPVRLRPYPMRRIIGGLWFEAWFTPRRGVANWYHSPRHVAGECQVCEPWYRGRKTVKKPQVTDSSEASGLARVEVPKLLAKFPTIAELVVQPSWEDGDAKGERAVLVFVSSTLVKLLVKVESPPLKLLVSGRSWDEAWAGLEATLRGSDIPWEQDTPRQQQGQRKKK